MVMVATTRSVAETLDAPANWLPAMDQGPYSFGSGVGCHFSSAVAQDRIDPSLASVMSATSSASAIAPAVPGSPASPTAPRGKVICSVWFGAVQIGRAHV